ncbi:MAG TPA: phospholipase D-like domain-containing protein [Polyangiaceae bacterium]
MLLGSWLLAACASHHHSSSDQTPDGGDGPTQEGPDGSAVVTTGPDGSTTTPPSGSDGGGTQPGTDGSVPPSGGDSGSTVGSSNLQILVEPNGNRGAELVSAINAATKSVHVTIYLLDDKNMISALEARSKAGLDVRVILNNFVNQTSSGSNTTVYNQLMAAGVKVILSDATRFTFTHEKCVIIDGATAWIMTMNLETSSSAYNREYVAIDPEPADVAEAEAIFEADYADQAITATGPLVVAPQAPNNARTALTTLIASATKTLDIEAEEFSDFGTQGSGVTQAVVAAAQRGVKVRLVLAQGNSSTTQTEAVGDVKAAGGSVVVSGGASGSSTATNPYIHAKAMVVDCTSSGCPRGYIGSENFTGGSLGYNRELGLIVTNAAQLAPVEAAIAADFAAGTPQ